MPVPADSVQAHTLTKPSRAGGVVRRSELVKLGAATCAQHMVGPWFKKDRTVKYPNGFLFSYLCVRNETQL